MGVNRDNHALCVWPAETMSLDRVFRRKAETGISLLNGLVSIGPASSIFSRLIHPYLWEGFLFYN